MDPNHTCNSVGLLNHFYICVHIYFLHNFVNLSYEFHKNENLLENIVGSFRVAA